MLARLQKESLTAQRLRLYGEGSPQARGGDEEVVVLDAGLLRGAIDDASLLGRGVDGSDAAVDEAHVGGLQGGEVRVAGPALSGVGGIGKGERGADEVVCLVLEDLFSAGPGY